MLMPKQPYEEGPSWSSRDYQPSIPCAVSVCPCNRRNMCELPSQIKIRADGKCQTGLDFIEEANKKK